MQPPLLPHHELFAREFVRGANGATAYAVAFPYTLERPVSWRAERARRLLRSRRIGQRVEELRRGGNHEGLSCPAAPRLAPSEPISRAPKPPPVAEIERLAAIAFDTGQPDLMRLIALRALTAGLAQIAPAGPADAPRLVVRIEVHAALAGDESASARP